jgi:hypothetical protein
VVSYFPTARNFQSAARSRTTDAITCPSSAHAIFSVSLSASIGNRPVHLVDV